MYDMYAFDETVVSGGDTTVRSEEGAVDFFAALQLALDRRDNGGDAQERSQ